MSASELIKTLIPVETARRIADGSHDDPFAVLGPHRIDGQTCLVAYDPVPRWAAGGCGFWCVGSRKLRVDLLSGRL